MVLLIAVVSFAGVMVVLPFAGAFQQENRTANDAPTESPDANSVDPPTEVSPEDRQAELADQAHGYELVLQEDPDNLIALRGLLDVRIQMGDIEGTIEPLERLAEQNPDESDYVVLLAQAKQEMGDREGSAQAYRGILSTEPGNLNALQGLVELLLAEDRPEAAIGLLQDTLQLSDEANEVQPGSVDVVSVQLLLGRVYAESERFEEALAIYDEAIESDRQDFRPILGKAIVLQVLGRLEEAAPLFATAESMAPSQYRDQIQQIAAGQPMNAPTPESENVAPSDNAPNLDPLDAPLPEVEDAEAPDGLSTDEN